MKKVMKKMLVGAMSILMFVSAIGCGGGGQGASTPESESVDVNQQLGVTNPYELKVFNFGGGYGREWLDSLITRYKTERAGKEFVVDGVTYDGVDFKVDSEKTMMSQIVTNGVPYDIVFQEQVLYGKYVNQGDVFSPMTEVLTTENPYEPGTTLEEKLTEEQKAYYKIDTDNDGVNDTYYGIPHYAGYVGIIYNKHMFETNGWYFKKGYIKEELETAINFCFTDDLTDRTAGPDGKEGTEDDGLPTTYEEFYALCEYISSNYNPLSWAGKYRDEYLNWFITALTANSEGLEQMQLNYSFSGEANNLVSVDEAGNVSKLPSVNIDGPTNGYELAKQAGKYYAFSFLEKIANEEWFSANSILDTNEQTTAQRDFVRGTTNESDRSAMLIDGVWWKMEADSYFEEIKQTLGRDDQDRYGWMPLPCPTDEQAQARAVAMQKGQKGFTLVDTHNSLAFLGKNINADAKKIAIDFLQFAYTDESLAEFSVITDTTKAVQYSMSKEDKAKMSAYGRSVVAMQESSNLVCSFSKSPFYQLNEETFTSYRDLYTSYNEKGQPVKVAFDEFRKGMTAKEYFDGLYNYQQYLWGSSIVKN